MKRYFPVILTAAIICLLVVVYVQVQWIENAIEVQRLRYQSEVQTSRYGIREDLILRVAANRGYNPNEIDINNPINAEFLSSRLDLLSEEDFRDVIGMHLKHNNIDLDFEFALVKVHFGRNFYSVRSKNFQLASKSVEIPMDNSELVKVLIHIVEPDNYILKRASWMIASSSFLSLTIAGILVYIFVLLYRQKRVGEIKSDFINNMTHEFKTPLATISLAVDALNSPKVLEQPEKIKYFAGIIKDENIRMNKQVQKILEAAKLEKDNLELNLQPLHMHEYIRQAANNSELRVEQQDGVIKLHLNAKNDMVDGDEVHLSNLIFNLLDNAIKYCDKKPLIQVHTSSTRNMLTIRVEDNGIGMSKETAAKVFEKFYRAHTGNVHNVKGFGLGLSYVKAVVEAHKGRIRVESALGKGSTFIIDLPILKQ